MEHIENVQKQAVRMVFNDYSSCYQELLKQSKTCTLEIRWKRQLVTEVYKATHNLTPPYITSLFPPKIVNYGLESFIRVMSGHVGHGGSSVLLTVSMRMLFDVSWCEGY